MCFATAVFLCGVAGYPVAPDSPPPANGTIVLDGGSNTLEPGQTIRIKGTGFASRASVTVSIYSEPETLRETVAEKDGTVTTTITVPDDLRGEHTLSAIGNGPGRTSRALEADVTIKKGSASVLPATGAAADLAAYAVAGFLLLIGGLIMVRTVIMRRPMGV